MIVPDVCQFKFHQHGESHSSIADWSSKQKDMTKRIRNTNKQVANDGKTNDPTSWRINWRTLFELKKTNEPTNERINERTNERTKKQIYGLTSD